MTVPHDCARFLEGILQGAEDIHREDLVRTPERMTKALREMTSGYRVDIKALMTTFASEGDALVAVRDIPFASLCEHHVLPFAGTVSVAYIPHKRIIGLSKIPRLVHAFARRLQVQERLGVQVADALVEHLSPLGVAVIIRGEHSCMRLRGVESTGEMVTSTMRGVFKESQNARTEVMGLLAR